jgi:hypothetical protein
MPDTVDTMIWAPDDGWRKHPKHVEQFTDINKLYNVASCWTIIDTYYAMHGPMNIGCVRACVRVRACVIECDQEQQQQQQQQQQTSTPTKK